MGVLFKNNAESTLDTAISAVDTGLVVAYGDGGNFPTVGVDEYFYMTIQAMDDTYEVVKVTARAGDSMTITRAQEGTTARAFTAGSRCELRVTNQGIVDRIADASLIEANSIALSKLVSSATSVVIGRRSDQDSFKNITTNDVLNFISQTQGSLLYRGASSWAALGAGTANQLLMSNGAGANPSWTTGALLTDGDKGSITVSSSGTTWTIDDGAVSLAKLANLSQYQLIGRSSSGSGVPQAINTSYGVYALLGSADIDTFRTNLGLGDISIQSKAAVTLTGGSITSMSTLHGTAKLSTNTTGTLALADADCVCYMTGNVTFNGGVFTAPQAFLFYSGASSRTITQGTSMTLRLGGTATTGDRTLAARTVAVGLVVNTNEIVIAGAGVT